MSLINDVKVYASGKGIELKWSQVSKQNAFIIDQEYPSFDSWLDYNLSAVDSYKTICFSQFGIDENKEVLFSRNRKDIIKLSLIKMGLCLNFLINAILSAAKKIPCA